MKILSNYPKYPDTFWSFKHALRFISKKAAIPPLGLLTVSAMLPQEWERKLIDMNVSDLKDSDIQWADYAFISAMYVQKESVDRVIERCTKLNVKIVAGGPLFTQEFEKYPQIDHFVLNEGEITFPPFLKDLSSGNPERVYQTTDYADLTLTPVPDYQLLSMRSYASMNIQITRGCPFACDFCEITSLLGHKVRMKETSQVLRELDRLYSLNWRGTVSIVDDNIIGNKPEVKHNLFPAMKRWMQDHKYPFKFTCQVSINLADDAELLNEMVETGFISAFIGIETPDEISLHNCHKFQNKNRDLLESVKKIQNAGIDVSAGFIVGFDSDTPAVFQRQTDFIQQSGIVSAMVGLLNAPKHTKLYKRLESENRLTTDATGSNTDYSMNFTPTMDEHLLLNGYKSIISGIYAVKPYYQRIRKFLINFNPRPSGPRKIEFIKIVALFRIILIIGIINRGRSEYWKLLFWTLWNYPGRLMDAMTYTVYGYHYRTVFGLMKVNKYI